MTTPQSTHRQGHCLCGAITITATQAVSHVDACHCRMCRRWGGGPFVGEFELSSYIPSSNSSC
tara:strand:+ start:2845 stop:3033 length:189 start_codon:yes stop_codon:yes gene_type:complete